MQITNRFPLARLLVVVGIVVCELTFQKFGKRTGNVAGKSINNQFGFRKSDKNNSNSTCRKLKILTVRIKIKIQDFIIQTMKYFIPTYIETNHC